MSIVEIVSEHVLVIFDYLIPILEGQRYHFQLYVMQSLRGVMRTSLGNAPVIMKHITETFYIDIGYSKCSLNCIVHALGEVA